MATSKKTTKKSQSSRSTARKTRSSGSSSRTKATSSKRSSSRRSAASNVTTDHEEIRHWAEQRQGSPACVRGTGGRGDTGVLRIDFPGGEERKLQQITWDEWFEKFDERGLAFLYQEHTARGGTSRFNKLVSRETAQAAKPKTRRAGGA